VRKTIDETWKYLESLGEEMPRDHDGRPFIPAKMPSMEDEEIGFSVFRSRYEDTDLSKLSLPRTFFGRSLLERVSFTNSDLSHSVLCWTDFVDCDFSAADLSRCDLRASNFERCKFRGTNLSGSDLCGSSFDGCDFTGADLSDASAHDPGTPNGIRTLLDEKQRSEIFWSEDKGEDPSGG
jgi:BTB/POZ domain-containing protein KCTD9